MNNIIIADTIKNALLNSAILEFKTPIVPNRISGNRPPLGHSKKEKTITRNFIHHIISAPRMWYSNLFAGFDEGIE